MKERTSRALEGLSDMEMKCVWQFIQGLKGTGSGRTTEKSNKTNAKGNVTIHKTNNVR